MGNAAEKSVPGYGGNERRTSPRLEVSYPARLRIGQPAGNSLEWFSHTRNVSSDGLLVALDDALEPGTKVSVSVAVPLGSNASLPAAQLDGIAVVLRSENLDQRKNEGFTRQVALRFLEKPQISTGLSMFS